jgi:hypothetical protein
MMRALILPILGVLAVSPTARADDTFEARMTGAQRIHRLDSVVWVLTAPCDKGDDTEKRQCRLVRDARLAELQATPLVIDADGDAFDVGAWNSAKKSSSVTVSGCIRCGGLDVDGKTYFVTASGTNPRFEGGKLTTDLLHDNARAFDDDAAAKSWTKSVASARVQVVVKLAAKPRYTIDGKPGIAFDVLAYRVIAPCDGSIVVAKPASGPAEPDKGQCTRVTAAPPAESAPSTPEPAKLEELTPAMIQDAMKPVVVAAQACYEKYGVAGKAKLRITVTGEGAIGKYEQQGDFIGTPIGQCIDDAVKTVTFPRTRKRKASFSYPIPLP